MLSEAKQSWRSHQKENHTPEVWFFHLEQSEVYFDFVTDVKTSATMLPSFLFAGVRRKELCGAKNPENNPSGHRSLPRCSSLNCPPDN